MSAKKEQLLREIKVELADYEDHRDFDLLLSRCDALCESYAGCAIVNYTQDHSCVSVIPGASETKAMGAVEPNKKYKHLFLFSWETEDEVNSFVDMLVKKWNLPR